MSETDLTAQILISLSARGDCRVWRQNSGVFRAPRSERRIRSVPKGAADISGIGPGGRRLELETKVKHKQSPEQLAWEKMITRYGGVYRIVKSLEDAHAAVDECY